MAAAPGDGASGERLGAAPLCEPSAALRAPWDAQRILVADNEVEDALFEVAVVDGRLEVVGTLEIPSKQGPRDIEALAALSDGSVLVVGSHSRNKRCEERPNRRRLRLLRRSEAGVLVEAASLDSDALWTSLDTVERCAADWFAPSTEGAEAVCAALVEAESGSGCGALNLEGALGDGDQVWLGLRAPLVEREAIALRMPETALLGSAPQLRFDGVVRVDLDGEAVRELASGDDGSVWIIAGASHDAQTTHSLWRTSRTEWQAAVGKTLRPERVATLPGSAEALVFAGEVPAWSLVDGAQGEPDCEQPARQVPLAPLGAP